MLQLFAKKRGQKGFTLIELLVVIAIIGIISSVVLVSLNSARNKGKDGSIKGSMSEIRSAAEIDYDTNGNYSAVCAEAGGAAGNSTLSATGDYAKLNTAVSGLNGGTNVVCNESAGSAAFAAWTPLASSGSTYWCVDSVGISKQVASAIAADSTVCP